MLTGTATDPPPANYPIIHSRLARKPKKIEKHKEASKQKKKHKKCVIAGQY